MEELVNVAEAVGCDGYDLCIRPGHPVTPENVASALPAVAKALADAGLAVPMATAAGDLTDPDHPTAEPILAAMARSGVPLLKLGYFKFDPETQDFWQRVSEVRRAFEGWQRLAEKHGVKICYHTHSNRCMASNASMLMHLIHGFDPARIGAFLDTGHMVAEGEEFPVAARVLGKYLSIVSLKDFLLVREPSNSHGSIRRHVVEAGKGMVDWTAVFRTIQAVQFDGPLTVHCEFEPPEDGLLAGIAREVAFMRAFLS